MDYLYLIVQDQNQDPSVNDNRQSVCVCVCVLSCVCECVTVCRCRVVQSVGSVRVSVCVSVCDVRRPGMQVVAQLVVLEMSEQVLANVLERAVPRVRPPPGVRRRHDGRRLCDEHTVVTIMSQTPLQPVAPPGGGSFSLWVDVQKLCNMCVLSLSWNFFVSHDKYIARPSSKEPR